MPKSTPEVVYLTLPENVGLEPAWHRTPEGVEAPNPKAGQLAPLREIVITVPVPTMVGNDIVNDSRRVAVVPRKTPVDPESRDLVDKAGALLAARIADPAKRIVECGHPAVTACLMEMGYLQCDPPEKRGAATTTTSEEG